MDFLNRLVGRTLGNVETVRPAIAPRFADSPVAVDSDFQVEEETSPSDNATVTTPAAPPINSSTKWLPRLTQPTEAIGPIAASEPVERSEQKTSPLSSPPSTVREVMSLNTQTRIEAVTRIVEKIETRRVEKVPQAGSESFSLTQQIEPLGIDESSTQDIRDGGLNRPSNEIIEPLIVQIPGEVTSEPGETRPPVIKPKPTVVEPAKPNFADLLDSVQPAPMTSPSLPTEKLQAPKVNISIGQLEIRVSSPNPAPKPVSQPIKVRQKLNNSLSDYMRKHD